MGDQHRGASGADNTRRDPRELHFPHSLGLLYSAFTYYTGFKVNSGEYKVMGLAPYGEPTLRRRASSTQLIDLKEDGSLPAEHEVLQLLPGPDDDLASRSTDCSAGRRASPSRS